MSDRYFGAESITDRLRGLSWEDRHVAFLVAAGYSTREISEAWDCHWTYVSHRLARVKRHIERRAA